MIDRIFHRTKTQRHGVRRAGAGSYIPLCAFASLRDIFCRNIFYFLFIILFLGIGNYNLLNLGAQGFGFGDYTEDDESGFGSNPASAPGIGDMVKISGNVNSELKFFFEDLGSFDKFKDTRLGDIFSGNLDFSVSGSAADAVISLKLAPVFDGSASPVSIDEAYARAFFGPVNIEGGLRKLSWGRADSFGPLDLINPLDYRDLSALADPKSIKIARPMVHVSWNIGSFSKLEGVFVPWFQGHKFASEGRWAPSQITSMPDAVAGYMAAIPGFPAAHIPIIQNKLIEAIHNDGINQFYPDTATLKYAQGGLRFTTSLGPSDFGLQYYFGRLPRPAMNISAEPGFYIYDPSSPTVNVDKLKLADYNPYHHIGLDYAQVIAGFNIRAEAGANITDDLDGKDGTVYNPAIVWSLGFDRDLFWGINANVQGAGSIRLFHDNINKNPLLDTEAGKETTSSRITLILSKKFFRDELELKATGLWGIEDRDFFIIPGVYWSRNSVSAELSAGLFGGRRKGELGQYRDNGYFKIMLGYSF